MKMIGELNRKTRRVGVASAVAVLASVLQATADDSASACVKTYPLKKCVVDGKKLPPPAKVHTLTHHGREIRLCSSACAPKFEQAPSKYVAKLERAERRAVTAGDQAGLPSALDSTPGGLAWPGW